MKIEQQKETDEKSLIKRLEFFGDIKDYRKLSDRSTRLHPIEKEDSLFSKQHTPSSEQQILSLIPIFNNLMLDSMTDSAELRNDTFSLLSIKENYQMNGIHDIKFEILKGQDCEQSTSEMEELRMIREELQADTGTSSAQYKTLFEFNNNKAKQFSFQKDKFQTELENNNKDNFWKQSFEEDNKLLDKDVSKKIDLEHLGFIFEDKDVDYLNEVYQELYDIDVMKLMQNRLQKDRMIPDLGMDKDLEYFDIMRFNQAEKHYKGIRVYVFGLYIYL